MKEKRHVIAVRIFVNDDDDVVLYSVVTPCYCSVLSALGRVVSFEACGQWVLLIVQSTRHLPFYLNVLYRSAFILLSVKCILGLFVFS